MKRQTILEDADPSEVYDELPEEVIEMYNMSIQDDGSLKTDSGETARFFDTKLELAETDRTFDINTEHALITFWKNSQIVHEVLR